MEIRDLCITLSIGALGAALAYGLHLPAPFLLGPAASVTLAALAGLRMHIPDRWRDGGFVLVGINLGSGVTPEIVAAAAHWPMSLLLLLLAVVAILWGGARILSALFGLDRTTATLASAPGHLSYVLSLGLDSKADVPQVALIQSLRVLALTLLTPPLVLSLSGQSLPRGLPPMASMSLAMLAALAVISLVVGFVFLRLRVPAALLLGAMFVSTLGHGSGLSPGAVPPYLSILSFVLMGSLIGTRFNGVSWAMMRTAVGAATVLTLLAAGGTSLAAWITTLLLGFPLADTLIAFAPGGMETMAAMALLMGADPAYVALHHVVRLFALTALVPWAMPPQRSQERQA